MCVIVCVCYTCNIAFMVLNILWGMYIYVCVWCLKSGAVYVLCYMCWVVSVCMCIMVYVFVDVAVCIYACVSLSMNILF